MQKELAQAIFNKWRSCKIPYCHISPSDSYAKAMECLMCDPENKIYQHRKWEKSLKNKK